jgi:lipopolysaccharide/colanic/teichoic acid biosynthesis glycosyltransferase
MIVIDSGGRPFFIQKRTGRNRKTFYCIKFRTMKPNAYANKLQVQPNDDRITRLGKYLRQFHIDELPQVINVLLGEMSIVGPRPHMLRHNVEYAKLSPEYHLRHVAKPGLTGLAQVRGFHGMINNVDDFSNRIDSDLEYIQNWSLSLDIKIFFRTTFQILFQIG